MQNTASICEDMSQPVLSLKSGVHTKDARVLLIEDDRTTRRLVTANLEDYCNIIEAPNASRGISSYNAFQPDLVFMDIELPDGDGQSLLAGILKNDPGAFVVMFTGYCDTDHVMDSLDLGAKGFISKPFNLEKMLHFIRICPKLH